MITSDKAVRLSTWTMNCRVQTSWINLIYDNNFKITVWLKVSYIAVLDLDAINLDAVVKRIPVGDSLQMVVNSAVRHSN